MKNPNFTKKMKQTHTILFPEMLEYHSELIASAFNSCGYHMEVMTHKSDLSKALRYINHDFCYPTILIMGQILATLDDKENQNKSFAILEPQSGGACRAANIYNTIIDILHRAGYKNIPVISLNAYGKEKQEGFTISLKLIRTAFAAVFYGDLLMSLSQQTKPCETITGASEKLLKKWTNFLSNELEASKAFRKKDIQSYSSQILADFHTIHSQVIPDKRAALIGEIYVKYSNLGNQNIENYLTTNGHAYQMSGFLNYCLYLLDSEQEDAKLKDDSKTYQHILRRLASFATRLQKDLYSCYSEFPEFIPEPCFPDLKAKTNGILHYECISGDGWLILAEAIHFLEQGFTNVLILHPFGCLVSHVCERGILKQLHETYPHATIHTIEYDRDSTKTLLESRIMLALS